MRRISSFLLALCMAAVLCGCQQYDMDILERGSYSRETTEYLSGELEPEYAMKDGTTIEPVTLVDTDDVTAMLLGITNSTNAPILQMVFDKGDNDRIDFQIDYMLVDGWQVSGGMSPPADAIGFLVFSGFSGYYVRFPGELRIGTIPLSECGALDEIHEIEFAYQFMGGTNHRDVIDEGVYATKTSNAGEPAAFSCDGPVLLEEDGLKIQMYAFRHGTADWDGEECEDLFLYMENNSDRRVEIVIEDAEVYEKEDPEEEEETEDTEDTRTVIVRKEKDGRYTDSVPLHGNTNILAGLRTLVLLQTADETGKFSLSDDEEMAFSLKVYDYETYDPDDLPDPLYEKTITLTTEDMFSPD